MTESNPSPTTRKNEASGLVIPALTILCLVSLAVATYSVLQTRRLRTEVDRLRRQPAAQITAARAETGPRRTRQPVQAAATAPRQRARTAPTVTAAAPKARPSQPKPARPSGAEWTRIRAEQGAELANQIRTRLGLDEATTAKVLEILGSEGRTRTALRTAVDAGKLEEGRAKQAAGSLRADTNGKLKQLMDDATFTRYEQMRASWQQRVATPRGPPAPN